MKLIYQSILDANISMTAKQRKEQLIKDELEFHEGGDTKKYRPPPEEYAKKLSVIEKYEEHYLGAEPIPKLGDRFEDTPTIPLEYYDNDDGFWDDHIAEKERKRSLIPILTRYPWYKH